MFLIKNFYTFVSKKFKKGRIKYLGCKYPNFYILYTSKTNPLGSTKE